MSRLGRNPFEKAGEKKTRVETEVRSPSPGAVPAAREVDRDPPSLLEWAAVDLPAQFLIGGLKMGLLAHSAWTQWSSKRKSSTH